MLFVLNSLSIFALYRKLPALWNIQPLLVVESLPLINLVKSSKIRLLHFLLMSYDGDAKP